MYGISVIMPCFNAGDYLQEAVESVRRQDLSQVPHELIIVNDGSTDAKTIVSLEAVRSLGDSHIIIHDLDCNRGQSAARNKALELARYDFILPVDADDLLNPDPCLTKNGGYISRGIDILSRRADVAFVYPVPRLFGASSHLTRPDPYNERRLVGRGLAPVNGIYRREEALAIGGYDTQLGCVEDWAFWIDMLGQRAKEGKGRQVIRFTEPYYLYRQHSHGMNVNSRPRDYDGLYRRFFQKNPEIYRENFPGIADEDMVDFLKADRTAAHVNAVGFGESLCLKFRAALLHPDWLMKRIAFGMRTHFEKAGAESRRGAVTALDSTIQPRHDL